MKLFVSARSVYGYELCHLSNDFVMDTINENKTKLKASVIH
jgi:hypothetical protein